MNEVAQLVLDEVPHPWDRIVLEFRALTNSAEDSLTISQDGQQRRTFPPDDTVDLLLDLRRVMYVSGAGRWFSMELEVRPDGQTATRFHYDAEPAWALVPDDATYAEDQEKFPRDVKHQPDWLRQKHARGGALLEGRLDASAWSGVRFAAAFTPDAQLSTSLDFTPSPDADRWAEEVLAGLSAEGIPARIGEDVDDESGARFPVVRVDVGGGYCSLAFWRRQIFWSVDVAASHSDLHGMTHVGTVVRRIVEAVAGWRFVDAKLTTAYERALVGLPVLER